MGTPLANNAYFCECRNCSLRGISDQKFSPAEAHHLLERPAMFPLCYQCQQILRRILKGDTNAIAK